MARPKYRDYGIRPKGSMEIACDPLILMDLVAQGLMERASGHGSRHEKVIEVFNFIVKKALEVLPPKQRKVFYSVWVRSSGRKNKGIMEFSRRTGRSHYTEYNNYYKAIVSIQTYLDRAGYTEHIIEYLNGSVTEL